MSDDRRASVRRRAALPFAWCEMAAGASTADICDTLGVPRAVALHSRLADLDEAFVTAVSGITDARLTDALRALDGKLAVLEEALLARAPLPPAMELELSAEGVGFGSLTPLSAGDWIGVHLVLPVSYHVVGLAQVSHCAAGTAAGEPHRVGAAFHGLDAPVARRLTRFSISRDRAAAE